MTGEERSTFSDTRCETAVGMPLGAAKPSSCGVIVLPTQISKKNRYGTCHGQVITIPSRNPAKSPCSRQPYPGPGHLRKTYQRPTTMMKRMTPAPITVLPSSSIAYHTRIIHQSVYSYIRVSDASAPAGYPYAVSGNEKKGKAITGRVFPVRA